MKIMVSGPITSWLIDGETMETVTDFISLGSKITVDGDCTHEIKRRLLLGRKAMTNLYWSIVDYSNYVLGCWERQGKKRRGWQRMGWLDSITDLMDMNLSKLWEMVEAW